MKQETMTSFVMKICTTVYYALYKLDDEYNRVFTENFMRNNLKYIHMHTVV